MLRWPAELLLPILVAGCDVQGTVGLAFDPDQWAPAWVELMFAPHQDVDVLFVVDNTGTMAPKQAALVAALGGFAGQLSSGTARQFHFGVVTTDLGAGKAIG